MKSVQDLSREIALVTSRMIDNGIDVKKMGNERLRWYVEEGSPQFQTAVRILEESGSDALGLWISEEELAFWEAREAEGTVIHQKALDKKMGKVGGVTVRVVSYGGARRERGRELIAALMKANPNVSLKDATLEVGEKHPELFR